MKNRNTKSQIETVKKKRSNIMQIIMNSIENIHRSLQIITIK